MYFDIHTYIVYVIFIEIPKMKTPIPVPFSIFEPSVKTTIEGFIRIYPEFNFRQLYAFTMPPIFKTNVDI